MRSLAFNMKQYIHLAILAVVVVGLALVALPVDQAPEVTMAIDPVVPLILLFGAAWYMSKDDEVVPATLPPGGGDALTEMRSLAEGGQARYFKAGISTQVMATLATQGLQPVNMAGLSPTDGQVFKVVPSFVQGQDARQLILSATGLGLVVMGSLSLPMVASTADRLVLFTGATNRAKFAPAAGQWAILTDPAGAGQVSTRTPNGAASPGPQAFDPGMPPEIASQVSKALADPNADPKVLEAMADELEGAGFPVAAAALRKRAATIRLQQTLADKKAGGTPFKIRAGAGGIAVDLPAFLAQHYTGVPMRWKEIVPLNPGMTIINHPQWGTVPKPWNPGQTVLLPLDWDVRNKPIPKPLGVPGNAPNPVQTKPVPAAKPESTTDETVVTLPTAPPIVTPTGEPGNMEVDPSTPWDLPGPNGGSPFPSGFSPFG